MEVTAFEREKQQAFIELYEPVHERFARYCMVIAKEEQGAKDLVNESLLRAFERFDKIEKKDSFLYFLFGTAKRVWSNQQGRKKFWKDVEKLEEIEQHATKVGALEDQVDVRLLYEAMDELPEAQKEVVVLFEVSGCSLKEIQEIQQVGLSAVKARLVRGRKKLAELLSDKETKRNITDGRS